MKLLYCRKCEDIFRLLLRDVRTCGCGLTKGVYLNKSEALITGPSISIAFGNGSFWSAIGELRAAERLKYDAGRDTWQRLGSFMAWVRPNTPLANPHTKSVSEEEFKRWKDMRGFPI